jgi:hypothetical protein
VYLVRARVHDDDDQLSTLGAFTTMREAEACVKTLQSQGDPDISIDYEFVHDRHSDWQWDRWTTRLGGAPHMSLMGLHPVASGPGSGVRAAGG